jgi:hypothetical protein
LTGHALRYGLYLPPFGHSDPLVLSLEIVDAGPPRL